MKFTEKEKDFLKKEEVARLATVSSKSWPQVTPIIFSFDKGYFYIATDYGTKKLENIKKNNKVGLVIDAYTRQPAGLILQGRATILEKGTDFRYGFNLLQKKFSYYRANPWKEGEAPILKIKPVRKLSWGLR